MKKIAVGISGASGINLGIKLIYNLCKSNNEINVVFTKSAEKALRLEQNLDIKNLLQDMKNLKIYNNINIGASLASGSYGIDATIIAPCSSNTLAKISNGISDTLLTRMAVVALKEQKKLILGVREMPFSPISLKQMSELSSYGVVIAPPVLGYYSQSESIEDMENFIVGKWLDVLNIDNKIYKRWKN